MPGWTPGAGGYLPALPLAPLPRGRHHGLPPRAAQDGAYDGQIDELYRAAPVDADVLVRADADVLPVANLEPLLDFVLERSAIAGVTGHYRFPAPLGIGNREAWDAVAEGSSTSRCALSTATPW